MPGWRRSERQPLHTQVTHCSRSLMASNGDVRMRTVSSTSSSAKGPVATNAASADTGAACGRDFLRCAARRVRGARGAHEGPRVAASRRTPAGAQQAAPSARACNRAELLAKKMRRAGRSAALARLPAAANLAPACAHLLGLQARLHLFPQAGPVVFVRQQQRLQVRARAARKPAREAERVVVRTALGAALRGRLALLRGAGAGRHRGRNRAGRAARVKARVKARPARSDVTAHLRAPRQRQDQVQLRRVETLERDHLRSAVGLVDDVVARRPRAP